LSGITADFSGAMKKTQMLYSIPAAARKQMESWAADTVRDLKKSARENLSKSGMTPGKKTAQLWRNIDMATHLTGESYKVEVGTGVGSAISVKYAWIQDKGGVTHPTVTPRMRRWAWAMYYKDFKGEIKGMRLGGTTRRGAFETFKLAGGGGKYKAIALTKKLRLDVHIPATHWFTDVINHREPILKTMMDERKIAYVAKQLSGGADAV